MEASNRRVSNEVGATDITILSECRTLMQPGAGTVQHASNRVN
jgi:hypothetical protein